MSKFFEYSLVLTLFASLAILVGCNSEEAFSGSGATSAVSLERIDLVTSSVTTRGTSQLTLSIGNKQGFVAVGHYSDGGAHTLTDLRLSDWSTSSKGVAFFETQGVLTANASGIVKVRVEKDGIVSNSLSVVVTDSTITKITVTPAVNNVAVGQTQPLTAIATYDNNTSADVTETVAWTSIDTTTATVTLEGLLSGINEGSTTVTATKNGIVSNTVDVTVSAAIITDITVTPATVSIAKGQMEALTATATYSDSSSSDVTGSVTWSPVDTAIITMVTQDGLLSGVEVGSTMLTAMKDGITSNAVAVDVSAAVITDITVTPATVSVAKGQTEPLTATATYSDNSSSDVTNSVTWTPVDTAITTVTPDGLLSGVEVGNTTLTATKDGITSNTVTVGVSAAVITDITVTPTTVNVLAGQTQRLTAIAIYSDSSSSDVTDSVMWAPQDTAIATVTLDGLLSGVEVGSTTLTATKDDIISNMTNVTVCSNLAGPCIDTFDVGNGKLYTNSPSVAYIESIGGMETNGVYNDTFGSSSNRIRTENGEYGPIGTFYKFKIYDSLALCDLYNTQNLAGRSNWRLPTMYRDYSDDISDGLLDSEMHLLRGWPTSAHYFALFPDGTFSDMVAVVSLGGANTGMNTVNRDSYSNYTSCVSDP